MCSSRRLIRTGLTPIRSIWSTLESQKDTRLVAGSTFRLPTVCPLRGTWFLQVSLHSGMWLRAGVMTSFLYYIWWFSWSMEECLGCHLTQINQNRGGTFARLRKESFSFRLIRSAATTRRTSLTTHGMHMRWSLIRNPTTPCWSTTLSRWSSIETWSQTRFLIGTENSLWSWKRRLWSCRVWLIRCTGSSCRIKGMATTAPASVAAIIEIVPMKDNPKMACLRSPRPTAATNPSTWTKECFPMRSSSK